MFFPCFVLFSVFEAGFYLVVWTHFVAQESPECWDYKCVPQWLVLGSVICCYITQIELCNVRPGYEP